MTKAGQNNSFTLHLPLEIVTALQSPPKTHSSPSIFQRLCTKHLSRSTLLTFHGVCKLSLGLHSMPICIECRYPVATLYTTYSKADDKTLGKGVRLTQCPRCKSFADKYVEHDFVILFIGLVLIKPQVCTISDADHSGVSSRIHMHGLEGYLS